MERRADIFVIIVEFDYISMASIISGTMTKIMECEIDDAIEDPLMMK